MIRRIGSIIVVAVLATLSTTFIADTASASQPANFCDGKSEEAVAVNYRRGDLVIPLRCGTVKYGFRHVVQRGRWDANFDSQIAQAISRGQETPDGTIYSTFNGDCRELFRVVVNPGAIGGSGFRPQGIITAYPITYPGTVSLPLYRPKQAPRECPVMIPIEEP